MFMNDIDLVCEIHICLRNFVNILGLKFINNKGFVVGMIGTLGELCGFFWQRFPINPQNYISYNFLFLRVQAAS